MTLEIQRLEDGEPAGEARPYEIVLGDGEAIPEVEDAVRTLAVGETGDFTVTFPEDFPDEERRGEKQHLRISLQGRKVKEVPELTDEFARSMGDFEDVDALRARIREDLREGGGGSGRIGGPVPAGGERPGCQPLPGSPVHGGTVHGLGPG